MKKTGAMLAKYNYEPPTSVGKLSQDIPHITKTSTFVQTELSKPTNQETQTVEPDLSSYIMDVKASIAKDMRRLEGHVVDTVSSVLAEETTRKIASLEKQVTAEMRAKLDLEKANISLKCQLQSIKEELDSFKKSKKGSSPCVTSDTLKAMEDLQALVSKLRSEIKVSKDRAYVLEQELSYYSDKNKKLSATLSEMESHNSKLYADMDKLQARVHEKNELIVDLDEKIIKLTQNIMNTNAKVDSPNSWIRENSATSTVSGNVKDESQVCNEKSIGIGTEFISSKDASPSNKIRSNKVRSTWHEPVVTSNRFDLLNDEKSVSPKSTYSKDSYDIANVRSNSGTGIRNGNKEKPERIINDKSQKKNVLIIGNSHTNSLDPDKVSSQYNVQKVTAFTISEADMVISTFEGDSVPDCIVFHLIVNDIKHMEADECVRSMCSLVDKTMEKFPLCKIVLSHAPIVPGRG